MVRALASHECGQGSIPRLGIISQHISNYYVRISNYAQHIPNSSKHILNLLQILKSSQHISKSSQHIRPRTPSVGREKGTGTQLLLLLPSTLCFVPRVDNNYKKVLFFCPKCGFELDANVTQGSCDVDSQKNIIETYFLDGFEYDTIVSFLENCHGIDISLSILKRRLRDYGLTDKKCGRL